MLKWLARLFGWEKPKPRPRPRSNSARTTRPEPTGPRASAPAPGSDPEASGAPPEKKPQLISKPQLPNLDHESHRRLGVTANERELLDHIAQRIESGSFDLPHLPATSMALVNLAGKPGVEVARLVELISSDPSLASELLRTANSVLYATHVPAETLDQAVMRIGLKGLRSMVFTVSVKGTVLRLGKLQSFSEEVWRQAYSVASISRQIAPLVGEERERAFLLGLLHDIGKIALLSMLADESDNSANYSPASVGRVFYVHHERAGAMLAAKWRLSDELVSISGCHHQFMQNTEFGRSAALASLAHKLDLYLSFDDEWAFNELLNCEEFEYLGVPTGARRTILDQAQRTFEEGANELAAAA